MRGAVLPKPSAADCSAVLAMKRIFRNFGTRAHSTEVEYSLLRACSTSAALMAAGKHTHVRTHRTSSDPAHLRRKVYLYMREEERGILLFPDSGPKKGLSGN